MKRKLFAALLAVLMLVSAFPIAALAGEAVTVTDLVNPKYADRNTGTGGSGGQVATYATYYTGIEAAGRVLRKSLKARETDITIYYRVPIDAWTNSGMDALVSGIFKAAVAHTGVGNEGDYLRNHIYSFGWTRANVDSQSGSYVKGSIILEASYYTSASQESTVDSKVAAMLSTLDLSGSNYKKLKKIYNWMCKNIDYDISESTESFTAYGALVNRSANHWGYASLLYRLALEMGVDCRILWNSDMDKAWNIATTGNLYYNIDVTGDAYYGTKERFLVTNGSLNDCKRDSEFTSDSFNSAYPMGKYSYDPDTAVTIVTQPRSVTVQKGETAKVTVKTTGEGLTYKWYFKNADADKFSRTKSFSGKSYYVEMNAERDGRQIYCVIADKFGNKLQTDTVTLSMGNPLIITQQPESVTVPEGNTARVKVRATGDGLTYKWYYKNAGDSEYHYTDSFQGDTYAVKMTPARDGRRVLCKIYDKHGNMLKTESVTINMATTLKITQQPKSVTVAKGETAKVTVKAQGDGLVYRWYYQNPVDSKFSYTATFKTNTYSVKMTEARNGRKVLCKVYDKYGNMVKSDTVTINMK